MFALLRNPLARLASRPLVSSVSSNRAYSAVKEETDAEFDNRWEAYFAKSVISFKPIGFSIKMVLYQIFSSN